MLDDVHNEMKQANKTDDDNATRNKERNLACLFYFRCFFSEQWTNVKQWMNKTFATAAASASVSAFVLRQTYEPTNEPAIRQQQQEATVIKCDISEAHF